MRVKRGVAAHKKHKKILKQAKGMTHARRSSSRLARQGITRALQYAYRDRRNRKRDFRSLWITRINAAARENGLTYGQLIQQMSAANIKLDRKILAELAVNYPETFKAVVESSQKPSAKKAEAETSIPTKA